MSARVAGETVSISRMRGEAATKKIKNEEDNDNDQ